MRVKKGFETISKEKDRLEYALMFEKVEVIYIEKKLKDNYFNIESYVRACSCTKCGKC